MPELPDIEVYVEKLDELICSKKLEGVRVGKPFLVRSIEPALDCATGKGVTEIRRLGKRIIIGLEDDLWIVLHLMVAGRLRWARPGVSIRGKNQLAAFDFNHGSLLITEAGTRKRASLYLVRGNEGLAAHDPGGLEPLECGVDEFCERLLSENRTLKRALTSPRLFSGIGNAYSDEILHRARLSPIQLTSRLSRDQQRKLYEATRATLIAWTDRLRDDARDSFPEKVTAFRPDMAVHGRFGEPCRDCGMPIQRIRYKNNETNYCAKCQTGGRILADRSLSRLLKEDWPAGL